MSVDQYKAVISRISTVDTVILGLTGVVVLQIEFPSVVNGLIVLLSRLPVLSEARASQLPSLGLLLLVIYSILPDVYPTWMWQPIRQSTVIRAVMAGFGFVTAQSFYLLPNTVALYTPGPIWTLSVELLIVLSFVGAGIVLVSFARIQSAPISSPDGAAMQMPMHISRDDDPKAVWQQELRMLRRHGIIWYWSAQYLALVAVGLVHVVSVLFLGIVVGALSRFYPVLELIALLRVVSKRWPSSSIPHRQLELPDIESEIYRRVSIVRTPTGFGAYLALTIGILLSMAMYALPLASFDFVKLRDFAWAITEMLESPTVGTLGYSVEAGSTALSQIAFGATPILMAVYSLWYFVRISRRLPAVLGPRLDIDSPQDVASRVPPRPWGYLLPLLPLGVLCANYVGRPAHYLGISLHGLAFLGPWGVSAGLVGLSVYRSRGRTGTGTDPDVFSELLFPLLVCLLSVLLVAGPSSSGLITMFLPLFGIYGACLFLVYSPELDGELTSADDLWYLVASILPPALALVSDVPVYIGVGMGIVMVSLWRYARKVDEFTE